MDYIPFSISNYFNTPFLCHFLSCYCWRGRHSQREREREIVDIKCQPFKMLCESKWARTGQKTVETNQRRTKKGSKQKWNEKQQSLVKYRCIDEKIFQNSVRRRQNKTQCAKNVWQVRSRKTKSEHQHIELADSDVCVYVAHSHTKTPLRIAFRTPRNQLQRMFQSHWLFDLEA